MYVDFKILLPEVVQGLLNSGINEDTFSEPRAIHAIRRAYHDLVSDSHVMRRTIDLPLQAGVAEYRLHEVDDHVITKIYSVTVTDECGNSYCYNRSAICSCNCCDNTFAYQDGFLSLCPTPTCDENVASICVSVTPKSKTCEMDERIYELYREYIVAGAISMLLPPSDAAYYEREFSLGKDAVAFDASAQWAVRGPESKRSKWRRR